MAIGWDCVPGWMNANIANGYRDLVGIGGANRFQRSSGILAIYRTSDGRQKNVSYERLADLRLETKAMASCMSLSRGKQVDGSPRDCIALRVALQLLLYELY